MVHGAVEDRAQQERRLEDAQEFAQARAVLHFKEAIGVEQGVVDDGWGKNFYAHR